MSYEIEAAEEEGPAETSESEWGSYVTLGSLLALTEQFRRETARLRSEELP